MNRRERLIASVIGEDMDPQKAAFLDTTIKFILADQGEQYLKFWDPYLAPHRDMIFCFL